MATHHHAGVARYALAIGWIVVTACDSESSRNNPSVVLRLEPLAEYDDPHFSPDSAVFALPTSLRFSPDGSILWVLDQGYHRVVRIPLEGAGPSIRHVGRSGQGPGEVQTAIAFDVAPDGRIVIADVGGGRLVWYDDDESAGELRLSALPMGVVANTTSDVWVAGDFLSTLVRQYDQRGQLIGSIQLPEHVTGVGFRLNQGIISSGGRGAAPCTIVFAFTFRSEIHCFAADGSERWNASPPDAVQPDPDSNPLAMSGADVFAYVDVSAALGFVFGLHRGAPARGGIDASTIHVFDQATGDFVGSVELEYPVNHITIGDRVLATSSYQPAPVVRLYRFTIGPTR